MAPVFVLAPVACLGETSRRARWPEGGPDHARRAHPPAARAGPPERGAGHDRRVEGAGRRPPDRPALRVPPQPGDLVALRLDLQVPARVLQVGRDGGVRLAPRAARALPVPAGHRSHRLRGHPPQPGSPEGAADGGREHDPRDEQRHLRRHLLGAPRVRHRRRRDRTAPRSAGSGAATTPPSSPASRRSTEDAVSWRTGRRPRRLDGRPRTSSGRATSSSSSTSSAPWCNPTSIASRARSPGSSRSARP